ncbi:hypothetical protein [Streptomyces sp. NBC_00859]|uniref:hypothetical protein n=1 Tax=Streptomyces sp. NBC_00859 TaxID=2903682 RepID=UPI0038683CB4|nr:hypothetical protein OG584_14975 [Streptomyces sp. NBC_00859]
MPVTMVENTSLDSLDLTLSEEANADWEKLAAGVDEWGGAFMWCEPCGVGCGGGEGGGC